MYDIRCVNTDQEFEQVKEAWGSVPKLMKQRYRSLADQSKDNGIIIAAYDNGNVVGTIRCVEWGRLPYYHLSSLFIKPGLLPRFNFSDLKNPMIYIIDHILSEMEKKEKYDWYFVRVVSKAYGKLEKDGNNLLNQTDLGRRYHRYVEKVIEPLEEPIYDMHKALLGNKVWDQHLVIIRCSLDNQYRRYGNLFDEETEFVNSSKNKN